MIEFFPSRTVALEVFDISIRWYGLMYVAAFLLAIYVLPRLQKWRGLNLSNEQWVELVTWGAAGVLFGGRLGYVLFYDLKYFINYPFKVLAIWQGGMSLHGGLIGVALALWLVSKMLRINFWKILDVIVVPAILGLALGRIGNVINNELFASVTVGYFVIGKDLVIAALCFWYLRTTKRDGQVVTFFILLYGCSRFIVEYWRFQEFSGYSFFGIVLTRGQILTLPIIVLGVLLTIWQTRKRI